MIVDNLHDIIELHGFKWNGKMWTFGFYRVRESNLTFYLQKFVGYEYRRPVYDTLASMFANYIKHSLDRDINKDDFDDFKIKMLAASRDAKLKRIDGYYKKSEEHYSDLHCRN